MILVRENGEIVEQGRHDELLRRGGRYAELVGAQLPADDAGRAEARPTYQT
jgi:ABC-type transport system involved in cytochrome bd biosynthesis fused ATPase/permease subunit